MSDPVNEVKDICKKLLPEYKRILLRYVQLAYVAENAARKSSNPTESVENRELSGKQINDLISAEITLKENNILTDTETSV